MCLLPDVGLLVHERGADLLVRTINKSVRVESELVLAELADPTRKPIG